MQPVSSGKKVGEFSFWSPASHRLDRSRGINRAPSIELTNRRHCINSAQSRPEVSIWYVPSSEKQTHPSRSNLLTEDDLAEFDSVRHAERRQQVLNTRAALRRALSAQTRGRVQPGEWRFDRTSFGKPSVSRGLPKIHFSVSHTEGLSVLALSRQVPVGIDVEAPHRIIEMELLRTFFSKREWKEIQKTPQKNIGERCTRMWSLKEAYLKMIGTGLAGDLTKLEFDPVKDEVLPNGEVKLKSGTTFRSWRIGRAGQSRLVALAMGGGPEEATGSPTR
jgi:4'-phosphopantetheinyl transferase